MPPVYVLGVVCPRCRAGRHERCNRPSGRPRAPHVDRVRVARAFYTDLPESSQSAGRNRFRLAGGAER
jgi:hypothetical protein